MGTCAKNLHMTVLHCIQVVDHFKRWTILVLNRNVLGMWKLELLCSVYSTHTIRVPCYCHIFNCFKLTI